jgi:hypothetical protein
MAQVQSILSQTPSLAGRLKITAFSSNVTDGSRWEHLIKTKLPFLKRFEFDTFVHLDELEEIIVPFQYTVLSQLNHSAQLLSHRVLRTSSTLIKKSGE